MNLPKPKLEYGQEVWAANTFTEKIIPSKIIGLQSYGKGFSYCLRPLDISNEDYEWWNEDQMFLTEKECKKYLSNVPKNMLIKDFKDFLTKKYSKLTKSTKLNLIKEYIEEEQSKILEL